MENLINFGIYAKRRSLDLKQWLNSKQIKTYEQLKQWCQDNGMSYPEESEVSKYFAKKLDKKALENVVVVAEPVKSVVEPEAVTLEDSQSTQFSRQKKKYNKKSLSDPE